LGNFPKLMRAVHNQNISRFQSVAKGLQFLEGLRIGMAVIQIFLHGRDFASVLEENTEK